MQDRGALLFIQVPILRVMCKVFLEPQDRELRCLLVMFGLLQHGLTSR